MDPLAQHNIDEKFILRVAKRTPLSVVNGSRAPLDMRVCASLAHKGDLPHLRLAHERGCRWGPDTPAAAAGAGNVACLAYAAENGCPLDNSALEAALGSARMACVQYLIQHGRWDNTKPLRIRKYRAPGQAGCIAYALDHGVTLHRSSLIVAASLGDLSVVRMLHSRGFPLWYKFGRYAPPMCLWLGWLALPFERAEACFATLRFGVIHGAHVPWECFGDMTSHRRKVQEVLRCFHAARRLSRGEGAGQRERLWAAMAAVPQDIVLEILELADLEIREAMLSRPPLMPPCEHFVLAYARTRGGIFYGSVSDYLRHFAELDL
jgi:hypothetical protein